MGLGTQGAVQLRFDEPDSFGIFKAADTETVKSDSVPMGGQFKREVAAYEVDGLLGFNMVPPTVPYALAPRADYDGPTGIGSLQRWVDPDWTPGGSAYSKDISVYSESDIQRVAILDYLLGSLDRNGANVWKANGHPVTADNGLTLPVNGSGALESAFVVHVLDKPLLPEHLDAVRNMDVEAASRMFGRLRIEDDAVAGFFARRD